MDMQFTDAMNPHRPPRHQNTWGRIGAGHHLSDPSPAVTTDVTMTEASPIEAVEQDSSIRRSNFLSALEQRRNSSTARDIQPVDTTPHHAGLERHTKSLRDICSIVVTGMYYVKLWNTRACT
jgi:hypothetical protein